VDDTCLRRHEGTLQPQGGEADDRGDVHDPTTTATHHQRQSGAAHDESAIEIDPHDAIPLGMRKGVDVHPMVERVNPGIIDEDVEAPESPGAGRDSGLCGLPVTDVELDGDGVRQGRRDCARAVPVHVGDDHSCPIPGQKPRDGTSDCARGARDEGDLAAEIGFHTPPLPGLTIPALPRPVIVALLYLKPCRPSHHGSSLADVPLNGRPVPISRS
jgi:hypothetical protein